MVVGVAGLPLRAALLSPDSGEAGLGPPGLLGCLQGNAMQGLMFSRQGEPGASSEMRSSLAAVDMRTYMRTLLVLLSNYLTPTAC
jgi:hypothetical protein